ncbi:MAG: Epimerase family protein [Myxococcota bacterium]|nr:Epimerase family protein [Myxococcota bacterium]
MRIAVSGASGLIGAAVVEDLRQAGHDVRTLRRANKGTRFTDAVAWSPEESSVDIEALNGVEAVIHLAGHGVAEGSMDAAHKKKIRDSRVLGTRTLISAMKQLHPPPRVFISASASGYYGDRGDNILTEASGPGEGFLSEMVREWEAESSKYDAPGTRTAILRFSIVMDPAGGALERMITPFKLGVGGKLGNGQQWWSWITLDDAVRVIRFALEDERAKGVINATSPNPARNSEIAAALGKILKRPAVMTVPRFVLRFGLGREMADTLLLASQRILPAKLNEWGFVFQHDTIGKCMARMAEKMK